MKVKLKNGKGQIGSLLNKKINDLDFNQEIIIYHTWNIDDKSFDKQQQQYIKFKNFVLENKNKKIIFISTNSEKESEYVRFKQLSESFLIQNCEKCLILKFPTLIGKGIFMDFKNNTKQPYGIMNIMTLESACDLVIENLKYDGVLKTKTFEGHKIHADLVYDMVRM
tara:strand:+ start:15168 stop:15668 length:501 start_codon:yes stop_codon:yes gene_type:complete